MADSPPASSTAAQQAMAELLSEITFQKVLLSSIDDSVGNRESAEREVRQEIKALESQLRSLRRGTTMASNSSAPQSSQPAAPKSTSSDSSSAGTFVGHHQCESHLHFSILVDVTTPPVVLLSFATNLGTTLSDISQIKTASDLKEQTVPLHPLQPLWDHPLQT